MMRRLLVLAAVAAVARTGASDVPQLPVKYALTTIDQPATQNQLNTLFGDPTAARQGLAAIVNDSSQLAGIRLRAIHALVNYPDQTTPAIAHDALAALINPNPNATTGSQLLIVRAAIEALGQVGTAGQDTSVIASYLDDNSRDVRAAAALALRDLGDSTAVCALRTRLQHEAIPQVRLAISAALRVLGQSSCP
jgi:HEAT repeat protein